MVAIFVLDMIPRDADTKLPMYDEDISYNVSNT